MADARLIAVALTACALTSACGTSPCGLKLQQHLFLPQATDSGQRRDIELPCCGASVFRDIDLSSAGDVEIDLTNPNGSGVDGFVTSVGCDKLFDARTRAARACRSVLYTSGRFA